VAGQQGGRYDGRVAIVTGASRGIGYGIAERLLAEGARVVITARTPEPLQEAARALREAAGEAVAEPAGDGDRVIAVAGKADDVAHQRATIEAAVAAFGRLDVLVNNTGINPVAGPVTDMPPEAFNKIMAVNVGAALSWTAAAMAGGLGAHPGAAVVNIASIAGLRPSYPIGIYGTSKAALIHLTGQLAAELAPRIRVNAVAPAVVKTKFASMLYVGREQEVVKAYPLGRLGDPSDIASAVAFLASDEASWITGQTLTLDGGLTLQGAFA
jgi:NAD(P)-dependent dehydrogenase (short-subunit alcohol dehydrogenase family)